MELKRKWKFNWLHIPTGATGEKETDVEMTECEFVYALNKWNSNPVGNHEMWKYWSDGLTY